MMRSTHPAESNDVIIDCLELDRNMPPFPSGSPKRLMKSGMIRHPLRPLAMSEIDQDANRLSHRDNTNVVSKQKTFVTANPL